MFLDRKPPPGPLFGPRTPKRGGRRPYRGGAAVTIFRGFGPKTTTFGGLAPPGRGAQGSLEEPPEGVQQVHYIIYIVDGDPFPMFVGYERVFSSKLARVR